MNQSNKDENVRCIKTEFGDPAELRTEKVPKLLQVSLTFSVPLALWNLIHGARHFTQLDLSSVFPWISSCSLRSPTAFLWGRKIFSTVWKQQAEELRKEIHWSFAEYIQPQLLWLPFYPQDKPEMIEKAHESPWHNALNHIREKTVSCEAEEEDMWH